MKDEDKCGRKNRNGQPCQHRAGFGTGHVGEGACKFHGGRSPRAEEAGRRRLELVVAERAVETYGLRVEIDPGTALLEEVCRTAGHVRWLEALVHELDPDALVYGVKQETATSGFSAEGPVSLTATVEGAGLSVYMELYLKERDHLRRVCSDALKAGIQERKVRLAEQAGEGLGQWVQAALSPLALPEAQVRLVLAEGARHLHLLQGGISA